MFAALKTKNKRLEMNETELQALRCGDIVSVRTPLGVVKQEFVFSLGGRSAWLFGPSDGVIVPFACKVAGDEIVSIFHHATDSEHDVSVSRHIERGGYMAEKVRELYWPVPFWAALTPTRWRRDDAEGKVFETKEAAFAYSKAVYQDPPRAIRLRRVPLSRLIRKYPDAVIDGDVWPENLVAAACCDFEYYDDAITAAGIEAMARKADELGLLTDCYEEVEG